jgi:hypothetical protein
MPKKPQTKTYYYCVIKYRGVEYWSATGDSMQYIRERIQRDALKILMPGFRMDIFTREHPYESVG